MKLPIAWQTSLNLLNDAGATIYCKMDKEWNFEFCLVDAYFGENYYVNCSGIVQYNMLRYSGEGDGELMLHIDVLRVNRADIPFEPADFWENESELWHVKLWAGGLIEIICVNLSIEKRL